MAEDGLTDLSQRLKAFAIARDWEQFHSPKNLSMALAGEAGELLPVAGNRKRLQALAQIR